MKKYKKNPEIGSSQRNKWSKKSLEILKKYTLGVGLISCSSLQEESESGAAR